LASTGKPIKGRGGHQPESQKKRQMKPQESVEKKEKNEKFLANGAQPGLQKKKWTSNAKKTLGAMRRTGNSLSTGGGLLPQEKGGKTAALERGGEKRDSNPKIEKKNRQSTLGQKDRSRDESKNLREIVQQKEKKYWA